MKKPSEKQLLLKQAARDMKLLDRLTRREQLLAEIEDWGVWLNILEMDVDNGREAFYDTHANSPHEEFRKALEDTSIQNLGVFMPRGVGKTYSVLLPWVVREIVRNPEITILMGSEAEKLAKEQRVAWVRSKLEMLEEKGYGPFRTTQWSEGRFTVQRPQGTGGQPTMVAWGPKTAGTGRHWQLGIFDDLYGEASADSPEVRSTVSKQFIRIFGQRLANTRMIMVGTLWPGRETYYYRMHSDPKIKKHWKILTYQERDEYGHIMFKCLTKEFLQEQRDNMPPALYRSQYKNQLVDDDELMFEAEDFRHISNPPPGVPLATYVVTDSAFSVQTDRRASRSCIAVIQKTPDNIAYVMDVRMGRWPADMFPRMLISVFQEWREKGHPPIWYCMETQGPGGQYPAHIADVAQLLGVEPPVHHAISHAKSNKIARIEMSRGPIRSGRIVFSPDLDRNIFYIDGTGQPRGQLGEDYMNFSHDSKLRFDGPDAIADAQARDAFGCDLCPAPLPEKGSTPVGIFQRSLRHVLKRRGRRYLN